VVCSLDGVILFRPQVDMPEDGPEGEVIGRFERPCQDEREPEDEQPSARAPRGAVDESDSLYGQEAK
jgi:hypothetical protein